MGSRFAPQSASIGFALGFFLISGMVSTGCVNRTGQDLDPGLMSFPIAIELSPDLDAEGLPRHLFVTSSNFALQYNTGNVQSYDLENLVEGILTGCVNDWVNPDPACTGDCSCDPLTEVNCVPTQPGIKDECLVDDFEGDSSSPECECDPDPADDTCTAIPPDRCTVVPVGLRFRDPDNAALKLVRVPGLLNGEVEIGSFSDGLGIATNGRRLYVPVRSDANITWIEVNEEGELDCGGGFDVRHACMGKYRNGAGELVNPTVDISFPPDPVPGMTSPSSGFWTRAFCKSWYALSSR